MSDPYRHVIAGRLKLKGEPLVEVRGDGKQLKRRKKVKNETAPGERADQREFEQDEVHTLVFDEKGESANEKKSGSMTAAERQYAEAMKRREDTEIRALAAKSYRERVQEMNEKIAKISEHHDIPKVGPG